MNTQTLIDLFLVGSPHAVVGASRSRSKYGNKVLRAFLQNERTVFPVNPSAEEVEGLVAYPNLGSLPATVHGVCIITPPAVSEQIVEDAARVGAKNIWFQPGAESETAVSRARQLGMNVIHGGPCVLVALKYRERGV